MAHVLNEQQKKAIENFEADLLVSAGAGTGKTSVLTEKYIHLLQTRQAEVGEIVAITFTNKAATEMRQRIQQRIEEILKETVDPEINEYWKTQRRKLENARICTFHSLCLGLIKEHPLEAGIPPVSGILNDGEELLYLNQAISEVITGFYQNTEEQKDAFARLLAEYGWDGLLTDFREITQSIRESGQSLTEVMKMTAENLRTNSHGIQPGLADLIELIEEFLAYSLTQKLTPRASEVLADFREGWPEIRNILSGKPVFEELLPALEEIRKGLPKNLPNTIKERVIEIRDLVEELTRHHLNEQALSRLPLFESILTRIHQRYLELKVELGLLDFTDQQVLARNMLRNNPGLSKTLRAGIRYILVDEFQDTNSLQWEIIQHLVGNDYSGGRWMAVGDVKQSIYRFRGAEAGLIVRLRREFEGGRGAIIPLSRNYRSNSLIIRYVNSLSERLFDGEAFSYEPLEATQADHWSGIEFLLNEDGDLRTQARMVAARIRQLVTERKDTDAPLAYKDIAILFRASRPMGQFQLALQELGIPYYMAGGTNFYQRQEIVDQINLLRLVDQSHDGIALMGLLKSPYVGLSEEQMLLLGMGRNFVERFYSVDDFHSNMPPEVFERVSRFKQTLFYLQQNREKLTISEIIRYALEKLNYREFCWIFTDASQRLANLEKLLVKADEFSSKGFYSTSAFLEYIQELVGVEALESDAPTQGEANNVVRLMTIHRSKGLEFPVVVIPDLDRRFRLAKHQKIIYHKKIGLGYKIPIGTDEAGETSVWERIKAQDHQEEVSELKRLLYVALTRAKQYLILAGSGRNDVKGDTLETANNWMKWFQILHPFPEDAAVIDFNGVPIRLVRELPAPAPVLKSKLLFDEKLDPSLDRPASTSTLENEVAATQGFVSAKPVTLKAAGIIFYKDCPRRFFYRFLCGIPEDGDNLNKEATDISDIHDRLGTEIGTFLHQAVRVQTEKWPAFLWERFVKQHRVPEPEKLRSEVNRMWRNFITSEYVHSKQCWDEVPFTLKLSGEVRVEGRFDRLFVSQDDQLILVDYKTHRIGEGKIQSVAQKYFWQLQLYALAIREIWGRLPDKAELYFLYPNRKVAVPLDRSSLKQTIGELLEIAAFIGNHDRMDDYPLNSDCSGCGYLHFCKAN